MDSRSRRAVRCFAVAVLLVIGSVGFVASSPAKPADAVAPYYNANAREGSILRLYQAYFLRAPDVDGFNYWIWMSVTGHDIIWTSSYFAGSAEFKNRYGALNNSGFLDLVYRNVMGRPPEPDGYNYWLGKMDKGLSRGRIMLFFSDAPEFRTKTATSVAPGWRAGSNAKILLSYIPVEAEVRDGYDRDLFKHWDDEDHDGCDTRCEVLASERRADGSWFSIWDGLVTKSTSALQIDHVVALAEAWDSGARDWDAARRDSFADWQTNLVAVSSSSNQSHSDKDATGWLPMQSARCTYAEVVVTTKYTWTLSVDTAEKTALQNILNGCNGNTTPTGPPPTAPPTTTRPPAGCATAGIYRAANGVCVANYAQAGDVNCGDLPAAAKPVAVLNPSNDPYKLDANHDGVGCS